MSFMAMEASLRMIDVVDATARHVALMLGYRQNPDSLQCDPSIAGLTRDTGLSRSTVIRKLKYLEDIGKIKIIDRVKNGRQTTNSYRLIFAEGWTQTKPESPTDSGDEQAEHEAAEGCHPDTGGGSRVTPGGVAGCYRGGSRVTPKPKVQPKKKDSDDSTKTGTRLSENWTLPKLWGTWAREQGLSVEQARSQGHRFHDYWIGIPGQRGVKLDWQATWRNRIRDVIDRGTYSNGGSAGRGEPMTASDYIMAEHKKKDEKEAALKRHRVG